MTAEPRKPTAFRLDDATVTVEEADQPDPATSAIPDVSTGAVVGSRWIPSRRGLRWGGILAAALGAIISIAVGLAIDQLIQDLFARADFLGYFGLGLVAIAGIALLGLVLRELGGLIRLRRIDKLRDRAEMAANIDNRLDALNVLRGLRQLYGSRPDLAAGSAKLADHMKEIIDGRDLILLAERELMTRLDAQAQSEALSAAKRVSVVTAISPRALVDIGFVIYSNLRLIRRVSSLYGGRPGFFGFMSLLRHVITHLAITGGMAAGDALLQQVVGQGLAARLSARLGEGVINGLLTARVGIAAIAVCRPLPFMATSGPGIKDFMSELAHLGDKPVDTEKPVKKPNKKKD